MLILVRGEVGKSTSKRIFSDDPIVTVEPAEGASKRIIFVKLTA